MQSMQSLNDATASKENIIYRVKWGGRMKLERILPFARTLLAKAVQQVMLSLMRRLGNGHDTVLLC